MMHTLTQSLGLPIANIWSQLAMIRAHRSGKHSFLKKLFLPRSQQRDIGSYKGPINALAWSPDSKRIATVSSDHHIRVRDISRNTEFLIGESWSAMQNTIAWSPTNKQIVAIG